MAQPNPVAVPMGRRSSSSAPAQGNRDGLIVGVNTAGGHDGNAVRGLAFQNFKTHLIINSNNNIVEDNWFGLSDDGTGDYIRNDDPQDGSGSAGVALSAGVADNVVRDNVFLGFDGVAAAVRGEGNPQVEDAIQIGPSLPSAFSGFKPAKVSDINDTTVSGVSGDGSPCPNCVVEVFLDDTDDVAEALQSLAVVTANASGNWTATIPFALSADQGLRTTSTTAQFNTIANMKAGTTTGLSELYGKRATIYMPVLLRGSG